MGICAVDEDYLKAAGIRLLQGRFLQSEDFARPETTAVINESAAHRFFPGESPLGKQILGGFGGHWKTVVGVIADTKNQGMNQPPAPEALLNGDSQVMQSSTQILVRTLAAEGRVGRALREELQANHPGLLAKTETLEDAIGEMTTAPRFNTVLLSTFASVALLMAIVGVYGVLAFSVTQRRQEIGVRMALGATPQRVLVMVMQEGVILVAAGAMAGVAGALLLTRYLTSMLYGVKASDPLTYAVVVIGLALAASAASFLPARRASELDPMVALRQE